LLQVKRAEKEVDKLTDEFSDKIDREVAKKEAEVMEV
jgi:ribosome recycling factor